MWKNLAGAIKGQERLPGKTPCPGNMGPNRGILHPYAQVGKNDQKDRKKKGQGS